MPISASEFAAKWKGSTRNERAAAQEHFIDVCRMLGAETPNEADPSGEWYAFEKGTKKQDGGGGFADVWKRGHFAWEYKGKKKNLEEAYKQLLQYREALESPPLLVVCDLNHFEIHTNFTGTKKVIYTFTLDNLVSAPAEPLRLLRAVTKDPEQLRPQQTRAQITEEVASRFAELAGRLQGRSHEPHAVAHFLTKILFCLCPLIRSAPQRSSPLDRSRGRCLDLAKSEVEVDPQPSRTRNVLPFRSAPRILVLDCLMEIILTFLGGFEHDAYPDCSECG